PCFTAGASPLNADFTDVLSTVSMAMEIDCKRDTPLPNRVPIVREKRPTSYLKTSLPSMGSDNIFLSRQAPPSGVPNQRRTTTTEGTKMSSINHQYAFIPSPAAIT